MKNVQLFYAWISKTGVMVVLYDIDTRVCVRFKEKFMRAMDQVAAASVTKETTQQKLGQDNVGNKMLQVWDQWGIFFS